MTPITRPSPVRSVRRSTWCSLLLLCDPGLRIPAMASGVENLWGIENARGLVRPDGTVPEQRFAAEVGYGLGGRMLWYPYVASDATGQRRFGLKLSSGRTLGAGLEFGRTETAGQGPEDAVLLRGEMRF